MAGGPSVRVLAQILRPGASEPCPDGVEATVPTDDLADLDALPEPPDVLVDCAGHEALRAFGETALARGIDVVTVSVGALADASLAERLEAASREGGGQLHLVSGAIGAIDALAAARIGGLDEVTYRGSKPPRGWRGSPAEAALDLDALTAAATHFEGTAREAALRYPKNANVAAMVALAGLGLDATRVELIADPALDANVHEVTASGAFGRMRFAVEGLALPDNPRSSALTAMSVVRAIRHRTAPIVV